MNGIAPQMMQMFPQVPGPQIMPTLPSMPSLPSIPGMGMINPFNKVSKIIKYSYLGVGLISLIIAVILFITAARKTKSEDAASKQAGKELVGPGVVLVFLAIMSLLIFFFKSRPGISPGGHQMALFFLITAVITFFGGIITSGVGIQAAKKGDGAKAARMLPAAILTIILALCCMIGAMVKSSGGFMQHAVEFSDFADPL